MVTSDICGRKRGGGTTPGFFCPTPPPPPPHLASGKKWSKRGIEGIKAPFVDKLEKRNLKKLAECYATLRVFMEKFVKKIAQKNFTKKKFTKFFVNFFLAIGVEQPIWGMPA
jgi:hypothetical protein